MNGLSSLLFETVAFLAPLAPAAVGGLATEYVGSLNIALEGLMLAGAFAYVAVGSALGPLAGFLSAVALTAALAYASDLFSRKARADSFVVGLGVNMLAPAICSIASQSIFETKGVAVVAGLQSGRILPGLSDIPFLGAVVGQRFSDYAAYLVAALIALVLAATPYGLRAKAAGMSGDSLRMAGVDSGRVRGLAYALSGLACGASGAALAASVGAWVPNISSGRGWIALVAIYLGGKRLSGTLAASAMFALLLSLSTRAQSVSALPAELLMAAPYFITALVVIANSARAASKKR